MYSRLLLRLDSIIGVNTLLQQEVGAYVTAVVPRKQHKTLDTCPISKQLSS